MNVTFSKETQTVIDRGLHAWARLLEREQETWADWVAIGEAIEEATTAMMHILGINQPAGKRWADNFGDWLRETGFTKIDRSVRSRLKQCMKHRLEIEQWRAGLPIEKRNDYNHPNTVWRKWNAEHGVSVAVKKGPSKVEQLTGANLELQDNLDNALQEVTALQKRLEGANASAGFSWDQTPEAVAEAMIRTDPDKAQKLAQAITGGEACISDADCPRQAQGDQGDWKKQIVEIIENHDFKEIADTILEAATNDDGSSGVGESMNPIIDAIKQGWDDANDGDLVHDLRLGLEAATALAVSREAELTEAQTRIKELEAELDAMHAGNLEKELEKARHQIVELQTKLRAKPPRHDKNMTVKLLRAQIKEIGRERDAAIEARNDATAIAESRQAELADAVNELERLRAKT